MNIKRASLLTCFLLGVFIITTGCRKERLLTKGQDTATSSKDDKNSPENLDGKWVVLEKEKVQAITTTGNGYVYYFPKETFNEEPNFNSAEFYIVSGEKYNEVGVTIQVKKNEYDTFINYRLDSLKNDSENLDPFYRYFIWATRINPELLEVGRLKLGKRKDD